MCQAKNNCPILHAHSHVLAITWTHTSSPHTCPITSPYAKNFSPAITVDDLRCARIFLHHNISNNALGVESPVYSLLVLLLYNFGVFINCYYYDLNRRHIYIYIFVTIFYEESDGTDRLTDRQILN